MADSERAIVVSYCKAFAPFSPRRERTRMLISALERDFGFEVEWVADERRVPATLKALRPMLLDLYEPLAVTQQARWAPRGRGALLIGYPFSPLYYAARRLVRAGIPYVLDVGDPWMLTGLSAPRSAIRRRRGEAAEAYFWRHAAGGVVTTSGQADMLRRLFPHVPFLRRPNGYQEIEPAPHATPDRKHTRPDDEVHLVHFGSMYWARLDLVDWLSRLRRVTALRRVRLTNFGGGSRDAYRTDDRHVEVELRSPVEWSEACALAGGFDGAIIVGNKDPKQLPSKAIQYLTLPIPRLALTLNRPGDTLAQFAATRPGFAAIDIRSDGDLRRALDHMRTPWSPADLEPPAADAWPEVTKTVINFLLRCWTGEQERGLGHPEAS